MRRLYVVTHPESVHHTSNLVGGWYDTQLTDRGFRQANLIAARLRDLVPDNETPEIHSSDLTRAAQTSQIIAQHLGVEPILLAGLREKSYGLAEGKPQAWLDHRFLAPPPAGDRMHHHEGIDGAETRQDFASRVYQALDAILASPGSQQIIVTHGFVLTFVVSAWIHLPLNSAGYVHMRSSSGGITVLEEDDRFHNRTLVSLNDISHLTGS